MFRVLQVLFNVLIVVLVTSFGYVLIKTVLRMPFPWRHKSTGPPFPKIGLLVLLVSLAVVVGLTHFMAAHARDRVRQRLQRVSEPYSVTINGNPASMPGSIIAALRFEYILAHHSHPTKRLEIRISDREGELILILARDSDRSSEYWVYSPEDDFTIGWSDGHEIGRINTDALNNY